MVNQLSEFMKQYKEKSYVSSMNDMDELIVMRVNSKGQVLSYVPNSRHFVVPGENKTKTYEDIGCVLNCYDYQEGQGCGQGAHCSGCSLNTLVQSAITKRTPVIKKMISKEMAYKGRVNQRHFRISILFPPWMDDDLMLIVDDMTDEYQKLKFAEIEKYIRENIQMIPFDDLIYYCINAVAPYISSDFSIVYIIDRQMGFTKHCFASNSVAKFLESMDHQMVIDRKLWLQCVNTKKPVIDNTYQTRIAKGMVQKEHLDIQRILLCPILSMDRVIGVVMVANKSLPYTQNDMTIMMGFIDSVVNVLNYKNDIEHIRDEQQLQKNLAETVDFGMFRFIQPNKDVMMLDYMNKVGLNMLGVKIEEVLNKSDVFALKVEPLHLQNFLAQRELSLTHKTPMKWTGPFSVNGRTKWLRISMEPAHVGDRGICWEGSITDETHNKMKCQAVKQISEQMETIFLNDPYQTEDLLALLNDLKNTVNQ